MQFYKDRDMVVGLISCILYVLLTIHTCDIVLTWDSIFFTHMCICSAVYSVQEARNYYSISFYKFSAYICLDYLSSKMSTSLKRCLILHLVASVCIFSMVFYLLVPLKSQCFSWQFEFDQLTEISVGLFSLYVLI